MHVLFCESLLSCSFATKFILHEKRSRRARADSPVRELARLAKATGQQHIFNEWAQLSRGERAQLISMCEVIMRSQLLQRGGCC